jgi:cytochrome c biogenesis protein CcdA
MLDGMTEVLIGILYISTAFMRINPISYILLIIILPVTGFITEKLRENMIYPRIGKIKLTMSHEIAYMSKYALILIIQVPIALITTMVAILIFEGESNDPELWLKWIPFTYGMVMFAISFMFIKRTGSNYYFIFGLFASILGLILSLLTFSTAIERYVYYFTILGFFVLLVGVLKFINIVKKYPLEQIEGI